MSSLPSTFTPVYVKREPGDQDTASPKAKREQVVTFSAVKEAPWAVQAVKSEEETEIARIEPVHKPKRVPWAVPAVKSEEEAETVRIKRVRKPEPVPWAEGSSGEAAAHPQRKPIPAYERTEPETSVSQSARSETVQREPPARQVSARNYAAVEHGLERYGLIDMGTIASSQQRSLLIHVRRRCREPYKVLNAVRPGTLLPAKAVGRNRRADLRVRFTTPARYYSPGAPVTTLIVGVDESDWRSLMATG
jgi:hypothetical protein